MTQRALLLCGPPGVVAFEAGHEQERDLVGRRGEHAPGPGSLREGGVEAPVRPGRLGGTGGPSAAPRPHPPESQLTARLPSRGPASIGSEPVPAGTSMTTLVCSAQAREHLFQTPALPSGPKESGVKGDSGRQPLILAPVASSFPGLGQGQRFRTSGEEMHGGRCPGGPSRAPCYRAWNTSRNRGPRAMCLHIPVKIERRDCRTQHILSSRQRYLQNDLADWV